jgi:hypothetical protein
MKSSGHGRQRWQAAESRKCVGGWSRRENSFCQSINLCYAHTRSGVTVNNSLKSQKTYFSLFSQAHFSTSCSLVCNMSPEKRTDTNWEVLHQQQYGWTKRSNGEIVYLCSLARSPCAMNSKAISQKKARRIFKT